MDSDARRKVMAGARLRALRTELGLSQSAMAGELGISPSYLNLVERNQRPVTAQLLIRLSENYGIDARAFAGEDDGQAAAELEEILADPVFQGQRMPRGELRAALAAAPALAAALKRLHGAYTALLDLRAGPIEAERGDPAGSGDIVEAVRGFLQQRENHFPALEETAEALSAELAAEGEALAPAMAARLHERHGLKVQVVPRRDLGTTLRHLDRHRRKLLISDVIEPPGRAFQMAVQLGLLEAAPALDAILAEMGLAESQAQKFGRITLANYFAAALMMPYARFLAAAEELSYDIEALSARFRASFEQAAHRLTTLSRPSAKGVPFFLIRVDTAGNVSKRFSAAAFPFARQGGTCPRWNLHSAFREPGRILPQVIELPDGKQYFSIARTVRRMATEWDEPEALFAVGLGCEMKHAQRLIYSRGMNLKAVAATDIGVTCRLCPRPHCPQRSAPPLLRPLEVSETTRSLSPFGL
jgi:hypothetical protein